MSKFKKKNSALSGIQASVESANEFLLRNGTTVQPEDAFNAMVSTESLSEEAADNAVASMESVHSDVTTLLSENLAPGVMPSELSVEAVSIVTVASRDAAGYIHASRNLDISKEEHFVAASGGSVGGKHSGRLTPAHESFDVGDLHNNMGKSLTFNANVASQDAFGEAFYPTIILTPDEQGLECKISRTMVFNGVQRALNGNVSEWNKRSVIDAIVDPTILASNAGKLVPTFAADGSNAQHFVPVATVPNTTVVVDGADVTTGALAIDATFDVIALSRPSGLVGSQQLDHTDQVSPAPSISYVYIKFSNAAGDKESVHKVRLAGLARTYFLGALEGLSRDVTLNFANNDLSFTAGSLGLDGTAGEGLAVIPANNSIKVALKLIGDMNLESGTTVVNAPKATVSGLFNEDGGSISITAGSGKAVADDIKIEVLGYDLDASRSNTNLRTHGLLAETTTIREKYQVPLLPPISAEKPVGTMARNQTDVKSIINLVRARTANNAVTALFDYAEHLRNYIPVETNEVPNIEGIARYIVTPVFREVELDFASDTVLNTLRSFEKRMDISAVIVDVIRNLGYEMNRVSNYSAAMIADGADMDVKPHLVIGTDEVLAQYIQVEGEERTVAGEYQHKIVTTPDTRMIDKIVLTFSRGMGGGDAFGLGSRAYVPEMASTQPIQFNDSVKDRTTVQPREGFYNHLPIMAIITVKNLEVALKTKQSQVTPASVTV